MKIKNMKIKNMKIKNMRIKNTRKNMMYLVIGRLFVNISLYLIILQASVKVLEFVVCNCITTIK